MSGVQQIVDGNTNQVVREVPLAEVPEPNRYVYLKQGQEVSSREEADQQVEIVRVVLFTLDRDGQPVPREQADHGVMQLFDRDGNQVKHALITFKD